MSNRELSIDLHPIFRDGRALDAALRDAIDEAEARKARELEIICGKGSGALRKRVLRFLEEPHISDRVHRVTKDPGNAGHVIVHFRWRRGQ